jgi:hypothetical protein
MRASDSMQFSPALDPFDTLGLAWLAAVLMLE